MHHFTIKSRQKVALDDTFLYAGKCYRVCEEVVGCDGCIFYHITCMRTPNCYGVIFKEVPNHELPE